MPRLPTAENLGPRPQPDQRQAVLSADFGSAEAAANAQFGATIAGVARDRMNEQDKLSYASAKSALLQKDIQIRQDLSQDPDYANYGTKYEAAMKSAREDAAKSLGANSYKAQFGLDASEIQMRGSVNVSDMRLKRETDHGLATVQNLLETNRSAALSTKDPQERAALIASTQDVISGAQAKGYLSEVQAGSMRRGFTESYAKGSLELMSPAEQIKALSNVGEGSPFSFIQPDDRVRYIEQARNDIRRQDAEYRTRLSEQQAAYTSDFTIGLRRGDLGYADVESAYKAGKISPAMRTKAVLWLDDNIEKQQRTSNALARVDDAGNGGAPLDPSSKEDKDALNEHFDIVAQQWANLSDGEIVDRALDYTVQKGIVPKRVQSLVNGNLRAGTPEQQVVAAEALQKLRVANPELLKDFTAENISRGNLIAQYVEYGAKPEDAVRKTDEDLRVDKNVVQVRDQSFKDEMTGILKGTPADAARNELSAAFDQGWLYSTPAASDAVTAEYLTLARNEYRKTGDMPSAKKTALDMVQREWGVSRIGDGEPKLMKFAPEKFYGVPGLSPTANQEWMQQQLESEVSENGMFADDVSGRLSLIPHPTMQSRDGKPVYAVVLNGDDGIPRVQIGASGLPLAWRPDYALTPEAKAAKDERDKAVEEARKAREAQQSGDVYYGSKGLAADRFGSGSVRILGGAP